MEANPAAPLEALRQNLIAAEEALVTHSIVCRNEHAARNTERERLDARIQELETQLQLQQAKEHEDSPMPRGCQVCGNHDAKKYALRDLDNDTLLTNPGVETLSGMLYTLCTPCWKRGNSYLSLFDARVDSDFCYVCGLDNSPRNYETERPMVSGFNPILTIHKECSEVNFSGVVSFLRPQAQGYAEINPDHTLNLESEKLVMDSLKFANVVCCVKNATEDKQERAAKRVKVEHVQEDELLIPVPNPACPSIAVAEPEPEPEPEPERELVNRQCELCEQPHPDISKCYAVVDIHPCHKQYPGACLILSEIVICHPCRLTLNRHLSDKTTPLPNRKTMRLAERVLHSEQRAIFDYPTDLAPETQLRLCPEISLVDFDKKHKLGDDERYMIISRRLVKSAKGIKREKIEHYLSLLPQPDGDGRGTYWHKPLELLTRVFFLHHLEDYTLTHKLGKANTPVRKIKVDITVVKSDWLGAKGTDERTTRSLTLKNRLIQSIRDDLEHVHELKNKFAFQFCLEGCFEISVGTQKGTYGVW